MFLRTSAITLWMVVASSAQFGPTQTIFRNAVKGWAGSLDVHGVGSGTVTSPLATIQYTTDQRVTGTLTLDQYNPQTGAWYGALSGTIVISETSIETFACTITNTYTVSTTAQSDFRGVPLTFNLTFDSGSDTWSLWPSNNSVNGTVTSVQDCAGNQSTSAATNPLRFMPINLNMGFRFPASGFDLVGTSTYSGCSGCGNAASNPVTYTFTYNLVATLNGEETVTTNPSGLTIVVDGANQIAPQTFNWTPGSSHTIGVPSPQGSATLFTYSNWSDGGAQTHPVTAPSTATTYTANFTPQYLLATQVSPAGAGSIVADPASASNYYAPGTSVQLTATANCGYQFSNWTGDLTGATNPQSIVMLMPRTVTANFTQGGTACGPQRATMSSPAPGSTLGGSSATFSWGGGSGVSAYWLEVGTAPGTNDIFSQNLGLSTSQTVNYLPLNGSVIWVRLSSLVGGVWQFVDTSYTAAGTDNLAVLLTPTPGTVLTGSSVTFTWSAGTGASIYGLDVGTVPWVGDLFTLQVGLATSQTVTGIPTDGSTLYVRLWTLLNGIWQYGDYTYTTGGAAAKADMLFPVPGSVLTASSVAFTWSAGNQATTYWLDVATVQGGFDIFSQNVALATSQTVTGIPTDGSTIYVRLWTLLNGAWQFNDYTYTGGSAFSKAAMTAPLPGSGLGGSSVTFTWSAGNGAATYWLDVATLQGGSDIYSQSAVLSTSQTVTVLPTDGSTVYVRLWTLLNGAWQFNDYSYKAAGGLSAAVMTTPPPGSTLSGSTIAFTWSAGTGAVAYWLDVGTAQGGFDVYSQGAGLATSQTVTGVPTNGSTLYVRLWTVVGGVWQYNDYTYTTGS